MNLEEIQEALENSYEKDLCYPKIRDSWSINNKSLGMCAITALIVNDYFNYDIAKITVDNITHYFNIVNDNIIDLTSKQFADPLNYENKIIVSRESILENSDTRERYNKLKRKVIEYLLKKIDEKIANCLKCQNLVEHFPNAKTVHLGDEFDILLVGEAPANNGWRKSHMLWRDINGKMLPSGVTLQKLFDIIERDILKTSFLEAVKCYPLKRQNLKTCSHNCTDFIQKQIAILNPKLIIPLGEAPTRILLNFKFNKFSEVVGNIYQIDHMKILPIYHPSPISPLSYKGNIPIIEMIKEKELI